MVVRRVCGGARWWPVLIVNNRLVEQRLELLVVTYTYKLATRGGEDRIALVDIFQFSVLARRVQRSVIA